MGYWFGIFAIAYSYCCKNILIKDSMPLKIGKGFSFSLYTSIGTKEKPL